MNKVEFVKRNLDLNNPDRYSQISDEFQWTDAMGSPPMDKNAWIGMGQLMEAAFPDLSYVIKDVREKGDGVAVTGHFSGTFTNDFDLSAMGMGVVPATGAAVEFPTSTIQVSVDGGKISKIHDPSTGPDAGTPGFLKALGVKMG
jgi:predicted ester cyclase